MQLLAYLAIVTSLAAPAAAQGNAAACPAGQPRTVALIVRHADRTGELLNAKGKARARALRDLVSRDFRNVQLVLHSPYERTRQTVAPVLERDSNASEKTIDAHDYAGYAAAVRGKHQKGGALSVVVIAGHSDTVRPLLEQFSPGEVAAHAANWFPCGGKICGPDYDDYWSVTLCGKQEPVIRKGNYGEPTPAK